MKTPSIKLIRPSLRRNFQAARDEVRREQSQMDALAGILREAPELLGENHPYHQHMERRELAKKRLQSYREFGTVLSAVRVTRTRIWIGDRLSVFVGEGTKRNDFELRSLMYGTVWENSVYADHNGVVQACERIVAYYRSVFGPNKRRYQ